MEKEIRWYPLPEVRSPEDNWEHTSSTASKPQHTYTKKYTSEWKRSPSSATTQPHHFSQSHSTSLTPSEVKPGDLSISTFHTVTPNTTPLGGNNASTNTQNIGRLTAQSHSPGVRPPSHQRRDNIDTKLGPSPLSHTLKSSPQTVGTQRLTLTELDELWKRFLASSLATTQVSADENTKPLCTCGARVRGRPSREEHHTKDERHHHVHSERYSERDAMTRERTSKRKHRSVHKRELLLRERAVQTTPRPPSPPPAPPQPVAPPVAFSLPPDAKRGGGPSVTHLSLSEALALQYPEFIERSQKRQKKLQQHQRDGYYRYREHYPDQDDERLAAAGRTAPPISYRSFASGRHPKFSMKEMYRASKKAWDRLPEVRAKVNEEKRKSQAATNRLRVKLYQQEVLSRLRRKKNYH